MRTTMTTALLLCLALSGCGGGDGRIPVVVYSPHGPDILREFEELFEVAHPDCDVVWANIPSVDILTRIRAEAPNPRSDVWWGAPSSTLTRAADEGLLEPYRPSWAAAVDPRFLDPQYRFAGHFVMPQVIFYNRDRMTATEAPGDWDDLLEPRWQDRIIVRFPLPSGSMKAAFSWLIAWKSGAGGTVDPGFEYLAGLHHNTKSYATNPHELFEAIKRDPAAAVGIWNLTDVLFQRDRYGYPFAVAMPRSGSPVVIDCIALVKNPGRDARRTALAREFYEFVTSLEAGDRLMTDHYRILTRQDVPEEKLPAWLGDYRYEPLPVDPELPARHEDEWMERWDTQIKPLERG